MALSPYMARLLHHSKINLLHGRSETWAVAELKVWGVPVSVHFPKGIKYSMFLVDCLTSKVMVGFDNHKPKGHHLHINGKEQHYDFTAIEKLIEDFWNQTKKKGSVHDKNYITI